MACVDIHCRILPHTGGHRILIWYARPVCGGEMPVDHPQENVNEEGWWAVCLSDMIYYGPGSPHPGDMVHRRRHRRRSE